MDDLALDGERPAEDGGGAGHVAGLERLADAGGGQLQSVTVIDAVDHSDAEAQRLALAAQPLGRAGAALAVGEVETDGGMTDAEAVHQDLFDEGFVGHGGHGGVKGKEMKSVDAERGHGACHLGRRHQTEGRGLGLEPPAGVGIETDDGQWNAEAVGGGAGLGDDRLMAAMHAVKGTDGDGGTAQPVGQVAPVGDDHDPVSLSRGAGGGGRGPGQRRP